MPWYWAYVTEDCWGKIIFSQYCSWNSQAAGLNQIKGSCFYRSLWKQTKRLSVSGHYCRWERKWNHKGTEKKSNGKAFKCTGATPACGNGCPWTANYLTRLLGNESVLPCFYVLSPKVPIIGHCQIKQLRFLEVWSKSLWVPLCCSSPTFLKQE